jgi:hypothetical protein
MDVSEYITRIDQCWSINTWQDSSLWNVLYKDFKYEIKETDNLKMLKYILKYKNIKLYSEIEINEENYKNYIAKRIGFSIELLKKPLDIMQLAFCVAKSRNFGWRSWVINELERLTGLNWQNAIDSEIGKCIKRLYTTLQIEYQDVRIVAGKTYTNLNMIQNLKVYDKARLAAALSTLITKKEKYILYDLPITDYDIIIREMHTLADKKIATVIWKKEQYRIIECDEFCEMLEMRMKNIGREYVTKAVCYKYKDFQERLPCEGTCYSYTTAKGKGKSKESVKIVELNTGYSRIIGTEEHPRILLYFGDGIDKGELELLSYRYIEGFGLFKYHVRKPDKTYLSDFNKITTAVNFLKKEVIKKLQVDQKI